MSDTKTMEVAQSEDSKFTEETQTAVRAELEMMLAAPFFAQSSRCKKFLSHIVEQALLGNGKQLKERMIGITVFERANDYDTSEDAIVRVTANDVRKRIGQFYQESRGSHVLQIDLPRGSYVPEFRNSVTTQASNGAETQALPAAEADQAADDYSSIATPEAPQTSGTRWPWRTVVLLVLIFGSVAALASLWRSRASHRIPDVWGAFVEAKAPVLVCLGTNDIPGVKTSSAAETEDEILRKETLPIDDISVVTSLARMLGNDGIQFRLAAADQTSLADLQAQPVILIGAADNKWTLQLIQALRYRIEVAFPSGPDKPPVTSIVDAKQPSNAAWKTDFSVPVSSWKYDYAIVAKENEATIGVPVFIEAGLGNSGSLAASESLTSGALNAALDNEPSCRGKSNFEAVIGTALVGLKPGPPQFLRMTCW